jgi:DNA-binding response OmpR family regulator
VLLASGYAEEIVDSDRHEDPLLAKPFSPETLLTAVDAVMSPEATVAATPDEEATGADSIAPTAVESIAIEVEEEKIPAAV